ncbi:efflux RND transporter periplasmic adaptor subunit [Moritella sp. 24]|uniref:efflux RND transporter periplasmic adaptor subunit n=1 Tax=Moritella sp. 24 TaxID=2746230 RepID=UPI001BA86422|nr:efflux RND transporter periplasmic adaptor subunit [Moritella sp. 24]QUM75607.1 efflux RND transporter periplasmic adaptor subunit [Moritella sp. 24]
MNKRTSLAVISALMFSFASYTIPVHAKGGNAGKGAGRVVSVYTDTVQYHEVSQSISLIGKLQSDQFVSVAPEVAGKVDSININANQTVKAGQLLVQLDDSKAQAALLEAKAYFNDEKRKLNEYSTLVKSNAITQTEVYAQTALMDIAKARLAAAQANVDDHYLTAPFSGTVGLLDFSRGKMVSVGTELLTLDDLSTMQLDLEVPERYLSQLSTGMSVTATSRAWPDDSFKGQVVAIDSRINPETLNLRVRVNFENNLNRLKPGMMMSSSVVFPAINEPIIPVQALEYSGTKRFVYVVGQDNKVARTQVQLGARIVDQVLIEQGLDVGDRIVVQGLVNMRDGLTVKDLSDEQETN